MDSFDAPEIGFLKPLNRKWNLEERRFSQEKKNKPYTAQHSNIEAMTEVHPMIQRYYLLSKLLQHTNR